MARNTYLTNVQILRFIAAVMVLYSHLLHQTADQRIPMMQGVDDGTGITWGSGVDIFFIVSGFIMYFLTSQSFGSTAHAMNFIRRRMVRIGPLYWIFTMLMIAAAWQMQAQVRHTDMPIGRVVASFLFYPTTRSDGMVQPVLALGWTLEYEVFFYFCYAAALTVRKRLGLSLLVSGFVLLTLVGRFMPDTMQPLKFWSNPIIIEFLMGMFLSHLYLSGVRVSWVTQIALIVVAIGLMSIAANIDFLDRWIWEGIPAFILAFGIALGPEWKLWVLARGGDASYSLYLSHPFALNLLALLWTRCQIPPNGWAYVAAGMVVCNAVALGVWYYLELPALHTFRRLVEPRRVVPQG